ncbi:uncharacterized protein LOC120011156 [Tripterygium wilfordii]|uniref:uncharacterized protein LOC120011156 n=1 Tax=Tripterygium wilfordii TaxID=458696 RepID=UPI0018F8234C|nr:uncharacterized protein LOC120011156 [Tripterygium wilfordii]
MLLISNGVLVRTAKNRVDNQITTTGDFSHRRWSFFRRRANIVEEESSDDSDEDLIKDNLEATDTYFQRLPDCIGRLGLSAIQEMMAALRILAYGGPMDSLDEYIKIGESTAKVALTKFCENILVLYKDQHLRTPTMNDTMHLMEENAARGFPGMIGSLDCMHWEWHGCPSA